MRSIIYTSLFLASGAQAADIPMGCFERHYTPAHIAAHPAQIVDWVRLRVYPWPEYDQINADLVARFIDQGRIKGTKSAGQVMDQVLTCQEFNRGPGCAVDCDGGSFSFVKVTPDSIVIETSGLSMGDTEGCGGSETMTEILGAPVRYRLNRVDDNICKGN